MGGYCLDVTMDCMHHCTILSVLRLTVFSFSCENTVLWRGHFTGSDATTAVNLTVNGGSAFAASVFVNDHFISTTAASPSVDQVNSLLVFPEGSIKNGEDNVITVVQVRQPFSLPEAL